MRYVRLYADAEGESHFEDVDVELASRDFSPPAPPLNLGPFTPALRFTFLMAPVGWSGDWHPAPAPQFFCQLAGEFEITASDGTTKRFPPGSVLLLEDTTGKGHATRVLGDEEALVGVTQLPD